MYKDTHKGIKIMFKVMGMDFEDFDAVERANSWVVGYLRDGNYGGYDSINVVAPNGFTKAEYSKDYGWTHY